MKDNDIIKALKWLEEIKGFCSSEEKYIYATTIVNLINRQQAEIERLQKHNTVVAHKHYNDGIKEFAKRLKEKTYPFPCAIGVENAVTIRAIDDLVKETVGGDNVPAL